jgi:tetratricopeptide (TPR) repeat protein
VSCVLGACFFVVVVCILTFTPYLNAQQPSQEWQAQVRQYAEAKDWANAIRVVDQELARTPQDVDVRAWRARLLTWSGNLAEAETEYLRIVRVAGNDPDIWMGFASVYLREGRTQEALRALNRAVELDPKRDDLRAARGRALRAAGERSEARQEFEKALELNLASEEARAGLISVRGEPKQELRLGFDEDLFSFASANRDQWTSLASQWTQHWATSVAGSFYQRGGIDAGKFAASVTGRATRWGALTAGRATGHDNAVIPKSESFFLYDRGWRTSESGVVRSMEIVYGQHWYWYINARILALNESVTVYLPREWTWTLGLTEARSHFSGTSPDWKPSGTTRLGFPIAGWGQRQLAGNVLFAAGTENFGQIDQIGAFSSHTFGGGLRFQLTARQDLNGFAAFQQRTNNRTKTSLGFSYGIHF